MFFIRSSNNKLLPQKCISIKHPKPITSKNSPPGLGFFWSGSSRLRYMSEPIAAPRKSQEIGVDKMQCSYAMLCHYANMPLMRTKSQVDFSVYKLFTSWTHTHTQTTWTYIRDVSCLPTCFCALSKCASNIRSPARTTWSWYCWWLPWKAWKLWNSIITSQSCAGFQPWTVMYVMTIKASNMALGADCFLRSWSWRRLEIFPPTGGWLRSRCGPKPPKQLT